MNTHLEVWLNQDLTDPESKYKRVALIELTLTLMEKIEDTQTFLLIKHLPGALAAQVEEQNMSPHSSIWVCRPGTVTK